MTEEDLMLLQEYNRAKSVGTNFSAMKRKVGIR